MKSTTHFLLLFASIFLCCCKDSTVKKQAGFISDIDIDFPVAKRLEFQPFNTYDILELGTCTIKDSTLWFFPLQEREIIGSCYNLHTGNKLSSVISKGKAANEITSLSSFHIIGDSIQLHTYPNTIKCFAIKDIENNIPMGERKFTQTTAPDSILVSQMIKLPNGSVLATIQPSYILGVPQETVSDFNQKSVALFNSNEANAYETIDYESFGVEEMAYELTPKELIKEDYANGYIKIKNSQKAVFSVNNQFMLYTFDITNGKVIHEKRYTKMQRDKSTGGIHRDLDITLMKTNSQYILCEVNGYFNEKDKENRLSKEAIFVFDWDLNPIKKFDLPKRENGYYIISNDCNAAYFCEFNEEGLTLYKADLNI